ncbi:hypothetical protein A6U92_11195 [Agrobacterium rubi]|nr:hypothetical protein A6U92_11195 [Agrobacterium rubi]
MLRAIAGALALEKQEFGEKPFKLGFFPPATDRMRRWNEEDHELLGPISAFQNAHSIIVDVDSII